eukprot:5579840-Prymnesium_polylepis.1
MVQVFWLSLVAGNRALAQVGPGCFRARIVAAVPVHQGRNGVAAVDRERVGEQRGATARQAQAEIESDQTTVSGCRCNCARKGGCIWYVARRGRGVER